MAACGQAPRGRRDLSDLSNSRINVGQGTWLSLRGKAVSSYQKVGYQSDTLTYPVSVLPRATAGTNPPPMKAGTLTPPVNAQRNAVQLKLGAQPSPALVLSCYLIA